MWDSLHLLGNQQHELVEQFTKYTPRFTSDTPTPADRGTIIPFPSRQSARKKDLS